MSPLLSAVMDLASAVEANDPWLMSQHAQEIGRLWWQSRKTIPPMPQACALVGAKTNWALAEILGQIVQQASEFTMEYHRS